jgi:hypothetical protein
MRYATNEKLEIIRLVEQSHLPVRRTLDQLGIPRRGIEISKMRATPISREWLFSGHTDLVAV